MKITTFCTLLFLSGVYALTSCSSNIASLPDKPASVDQVKKWLVTKKYTTKKTGMYGSLTINDKTEMVWIDAATEPDKTTKEAVEEELKFTIHFLNDTAAMVFKKIATYAATYSVDDIAGEDDTEKPGIKLRLVYEDPDFSFGGKPSKVTYTYLVRGADEKQLLLQLPKSVNRKPLVSLLETK